MTTQQYQQIARRRQKQREQRAALLVVIGIVLFIFGLGVLFGWHLGTVHACAVEPVPEELTEQAKQTPQITHYAAITNADFKATETPAVSTTNLIVSEGNALSPELQKVMQEKCEEVNQYARKN